MAEPMELRSSVTCRARLRDVPSRQAPAERPNPQQSAQRPANPLGAVRTHAHLVAAGASGIYVHGTHDGRTDGDLMVGSLGCSGRRDPSMAFFSVQFQ